MRDRIKCLKCEKFFYRNNKSVVCPTCIQKDSKEYYTKKIADLEAKLVKNRKWLASNEGFLENQQLKQQLAEKDKELYLTKATLQHHTNIYNNLMSDLKTIKINYAVEQLEKLKDIIYRFDVSYDEINNLTIALDNYTNGFHKAKFKATILIDNQIKQLKEGK